jgi:sigma-B regulation protein RsbU (phosphoserine phosphatase)
MKKLFLSDWWQALRARSSLAIIITAAVFIEATSVIQYLFAQKGIRDEVEHRAQSELRAKSLEIHGVLNSIEVAIENTAWLMEQHVNSPDELYTICDQLLTHSPNLVGMGIGYAPDYFPQHGRWYELYVGRNDDGTFSHHQIGSEQHDYLESDWYKRTIAEGKGVWTEPYFDEAGANMMLCSFTKPLRDATGRIVAIVGADVSVDWLSDVINAHPIYPSSFSLMISRQGQIMACPVESLVMRQNIQDASSQIKDTSARFVNQQMMSGKSGQATVKDDKGNKNYVFFAPVVGSTGWSMAIVCSDREIYYTLRQIGFNLMLMMLVCLGLLAFIIARAGRSFKKLQEANATKASIESELRIASNIQMAMLPKIFPPYPERDDIEVFGSLTPAKAVGGDLYDFYIRDEKLFFCIGDVSGKGVPASLVMAVMRTHFRTVSAHESAPDRILMTINEALSPDNDSNMFVTLFVGVLDLPTGRLYYSNAGHDAPLLIGNGESKLPVEANIPIGVMAGWKYKSQEMLINPQTTIFLYTDGLTEATNKDNELFGLERVEKLARTLTTPDDQQPSLMLKRMTAAVETFVGDAEQSDDLTMLAIRYTKHEREERLQRSIDLPNDVQTVPQLAEFVDEICEALGFDMGTTMQMNLALEEAVVNVMNYAYPAGTEGKIHIEAQVNDIRLKFVITDSGVPFDPTVKGEADVTLSAEERPVGGLGIFLVRQIMDSINYERINDQNILTLRKNLQKTEK